jgi:glutaredoxin
MTTRDSVPILYTQTDCADSARVRAWLGEHQIPFIERNVTGNLAAAQELMATGTFATPLLVVGQHQVIGYRPAQLAAALGIEQT